MVRELEGEKLNGWLEGAEACAAPAMRSFAAGLRKDLAAVRAGLTETWSNGSVEGFVHKLKLLKRATGGPASSYSGRGCRPPEDRPEGGSGTQTPLHQEADRAE